MLFLANTKVLADSYDPQNYPPPINNYILEQTNLPIVFIDTRCGESTTKAIHKDYRIAARMKIINNKNGINYGDTIAHPQQTIDYEGWIAIRYRGNTSFYWSDKKPYNFKTMQTNDPTGKKQKTKLLGMPKDNTWVLLAPYGDRSLLRDVLVFQLARPYFEYTPRCKYCEMILDGVYYGIFILAENIRKSEHRLNLDDSSYNKIYFQYKHPEYDELLPVQDDYIQNQIYLMESSLASEDFTNPETGYRRYLDELSFIDQQLTQEFSGNVDGYRLSTYIYKRRDSKDSRFKTAIWDFNLAFGNSNTANAKGVNFWRYKNSYLNSYNAYNKVPFWWMRLMEDAAYIKQLKERWTQYRQENYNLDKIESTIDSITTLLRVGGALERNNTVWKMFKSTTYEMEIENLKTWINNRVAWMDEQLEYNIIIIYKEKY